MGETVGARLHAEAAAGWKPAVPGWGGGRWVGGVLGSGEIGDGRWESRGAGEVLGVGDSRIRQVGNLPHVGVPAGGGCGGWRAGGMSESPDVVSYKLGVVRRAGW